MSHNVLNGLESVSIDGIGATPLTQGGAPSEIVALPNANTNVAATGVIPAGTKYIEIGCDVSCVVAIGEATSATVGRFVPVGGAVYSVPADAIGQHVNVQSAVGGAAPRIAYMAG